MDLLYLSQLQDRMDGTVEERFGIETDMLAERCLAFLGELSETVDAWRRAKFWSQSQTPELGLLEEYIDGFHFLLSISKKAGIDLNDVELPKSEKEEEGSYATIREMFFNMYGYMVSFHKGLPLSYYPEIVTQYLRLGLELGFSYSDIERAYLKKNDVNLQRQAEGY